MRVTREIAVSPAKVWDLLVDTERWPAWGPSVVAVDAPEQRIGPGSRGRVRTAVGVWVPFEITEFVEGRRWAWKVLGIPATTHEVESTAGGCRVTFGVPALAAPYAIICRLALDRIERLATA